MRHNLSTILRLNFLFRLVCVVGANSEIGCWTRVEGTPCDPNPDKPFAKMENAPLFNDEGRLNPSITILGNYLVLLLLIL